MTSSKLINRLIRILPLPPHQAQEKERQAQEKEITEKLKFEKEERERIEKLHFEKAEKDRAFELERIKLEQEMEIQRIRSEHELKLAEVQGVQHGDNGEVNGAEANPTQNNGSRSVAMKALKLSPFNEDKDDLDAYLTRFERACTACEIRPEYWSTQLVRLLQGRSANDYCNDVKMPNSISFAVQYSRSFNDT